jgi:hypothetical protein
MCCDEYRPVAVTGLKGRSPIEMKKEDQEGKHNMQCLVGRVNCSVSESDEDVFTIVLIQY